MKLNKALKVKNRLIGELNRTRQLIRTENSRRSDSVSKFDLSELQGNLIKLENKFIDLKTKIAEATAPISRQLTKLTFLKDNINFYNTIPTRKGVEKVAYGNSSTIEEYTWTAYFDKESIEAFVSDFQKEIDELQDEVDEFNAKTDIEFVE